MYRIFKSLTIFLIAFIIVGCTSSGQTKTFIKESKGIKQEIIYTYKGDTVLTQTTSNVLTFKELEITKEQFELTIESVKDSYKGITGLEHSLEITDEGATEKIFIDHSKIDKEKLQQLGGSEISKDSSTEISMKATEDVLKNQGYTEK